MTALAVVLAVAGCSYDHRDPPRALVDGSAVRDVPVPLEGVDQPRILTSVDVVSAGELEAGSVPAECLRGRFAHLRAAGPVVVRVAVDAESVTFREADGRGLAGCIDTPGARPDDRRWCGGAYGALSSGRLQDPRLDLGCRTTDGEPVSSIWVEPGQGAWYVVVMQTGYAEVYETTGGLPVRVASKRGIELSRTQATFELREHDRWGRLLRRYRVEAAVAG